MGLSSNPERRLKEHNKGDNRFTKGHRPWILIYKEQFENRIQARKREIILKRTYYKQKILKNIEDSGVVQR